MEQMLEKPSAVKKKKQRSAETTKPKENPEEVKPEQHLQEESKHDDDNNKESSNYAANSEPSLLETPTTTDNMATLPSQSIVVPTADNKLDNILRMNQDLANAIKAEQMDERFQNIEKIIIKPITAPVASIDHRQAHMQPYTERQLAALYTNSELDMLGDFTKQYIEVHLKGLATEQHPLYELLATYLNVREKITGNTLELDRLRNEYKALENDLWTLETAKVNGRGECQDGNIVVATHSYQKAKFHRAVFKSVSRVLGNIKTLTYENHVLYSFSAEDLRLQIELYIQTAIANCINVTKLDRNSPVILSMENEPLHFKPYLSEIRLCMSILFAFQRKLIRNVQFRKETREWLSRLAAVLLRLATYQDHLFILSHILRCPAGVSSWASNFIQTPLNLNVDDSPFSNYQINHVLVILTCILSPVEERQKFLEDIIQAKESSWTMVDSEGEEDDEFGNSLKENDLVGLLAQLPFEDLFRAILLVEKKDFENSYRHVDINEQHIFRFFAFSTVLLKILNKGLNTYNHQRYSQFSKRLSRLIRHIVQYATDQWEQFKKSNNTTDSAMLERLQIEYDAFFLRAIYYLYSSQKMGGWQFLAVVPYQLIRINTIWKIFYFLHNSDQSAQEILNPSDTIDYSQRIGDANLRLQFDEKMRLLAYDESYYLMNTFANIALARSIEDIEFIEVSTMDLLQIGFVNETTQDIYSKPATTLITHITSKHPHLLSNILKYVEQNMSRIGSLALHLYEELPLSIWQITDDDLKLIARLLMSHNIAADETKLARMILSRLNWDLLAYEMHCNVALLVVEATDKEPGYLQWGWQTIVRLKLHIFDKGFDDMRKVFEPESYDVIMKGIRQQQPLASFVAVLMTSWGHLVPLICTQGMSQLLFLQTSHQKHEAVLFALYLIVPLFSNCQEDLINCEKFQLILSNLINADRSYISVAKSLISTQTTMTVLQQFGNMIETQIATFNYYNLQSPRCLVRLWMNSFLSIPHWNRDYGVLYLLDVIIRAAFFHADSVEVIYLILKELIVQNLSTTDQTGTIGSIIKWVSNTTSSSTLISCPLASYPWLAYVFIEIEYEIHEKINGFWIELLTQLNKQQGKINVDAAIKKSTSNLKLLFFTSGSLCIYRWAQQAMDTSIDHPLLPLLWQKFFYLYLARIPVAAPGGKGCVGAKFFDGLVNYAFFKKIKKRLQESIDFYEKTFAVQENDAKQRSFYENCLKIFRAFALWLEEPHLQEANLFLPSLPQQCEPSFLALIIQGTNTPWLEFVDYDRIKSEQLDSIKIWKLANFRQKSNVNKPLTNPGNSIESADPVERILRRLKVYEIPKSPPNIQNVAPIVPMIDFSNTETMLKSLDNCFKTLKQFAHNHTLKLSEHTALDCSYQELVPQLYRSVLQKIHKKIPCKGRNQTVYCQGAAIIVLEMQEARIDDSVNHRIQTNRSLYESLLNQSLQNPAVSLCAASITIQQAIKILQMQLRCHPGSAELGAELFYHILSMINEETNAYLPSKTLIVSCLEKLGQSHICGVEFEMPRLLEKILKEPNLGEYLAPHFSPGHVGTSNLLFMYSTIGQEIGIKYDVIFALLSKFDIDYWLKNKQPKSNQRTEFIQCIIKSLTMLGFEPPIDAYVLHGLYRKHLIAVFEHQFPEHYGEILTYLLKASNGNPDNTLISTTVWLDIINSLSKPIQINLKLSLRDQFRQYAQNQQMLQHQELLETADLFTRHFTQERLQYGLFGLYPKCRNYVDVYAVLLGMTGHGIVISMINAHEGMLGGTLCEKIWPYLRNIFTPWIVPYSMQNVQENMASWIQQLTDDRSILLPWIAADEPSAQKIVAVFYECVQFVIHTLPGSGNILSFLWQWYANSFAHTSIKPYIFRPIHNTFLAFPWHSFWPSLIDLELMLKVIDQYLPECHSFLGHIFMCVPWTNWFKNSANLSNPIKSRVYQCFINLLVKLSNEPNVRTKYENKIKHLLVEAENFDWNILDVTVFQYIMDWYVLSCDPLVILKGGPVDLDCRVLSLLKIVSCYNKPLENPTPDQLNKRLIYVRSYVKLLSVFTSRYKSLLPNKDPELYSVIVQQLNDLEKIVLNEDELNNLLREFLSILNIDAIQQITIKCFNQWISNKLGNSLVIKCLLQTLGVSICDYDIVSQLFELTLTSYFHNNASFDPSWTDITDNLHLVISKQTEMEQNFLKNGHCLSLYAILRQRISKCSDFETLLNKLLEWFLKMKINESNESKVPLLWSSFLDLSIKLCNQDELSAGAILYRFSKILRDMSENKDSTSWRRGLLNAIGLNKQETVSLTFRFLCRALAGYILAQLPEMKGEPQVVRHQANAPNKVGQPGGNTECVKVLMNLGLGQSQGGKIKDCEELVLKQIQDSSNSLHNSKQFLVILLKQFYNKPYLKDIA